jgi:peroxin-13
MVFENGVIEINNCHWMQLCDRAGVLYGELARFVLRLLGVRSKGHTRPKSPPVAPALPSGTGDASNNWDSVWGK